MIISCECKKYRFAVRAEDIGKNGRLVQCGVCDKKWFQEPASSEEFQTLKNNYVEEEKKQERNKNSDSIKEKDKKNYVPIKYEKKNNTNYTKFLFIILIVSGIVLAVSFENREYIISKKPELTDFFNILKEFIEYLTKYYSDITEIFFVKPK